MARATLIRVAIRALREVVIDASPEAIIDTLADVDSLPLWSLVHSDVDLIGTYRTVALTTSV